MAINIPELSFDRPLVGDNGEPSVESRLFFRAVMDRALIIGTGSPEGVVPAFQGASYMDDAGTAGSISYLKRDADIAGDQKLGWILV